MAEIQHGWIRTQDYRGPERRLQARRATVETEEWGWRMFNLGLIDDECRTSFGRRVGDVPFALLADEGPRANRNHKR